jgi:hypothetical protein
MQIIPTSYAGSIVNDKARLWQAKRYSWLPDVPAKLTSSEIYAIRLPKIEVGCKKVTKREILSGLNSGREVFKAISILRRPRLPHNLGL